MTLKKFIDRTGFYPDWALYEVIQAHYVGFNGGIDSFCKAYKENTDGLAEKIQNEANMARYNVERNHAAELAQLTKRLDKVWEDLGDALTALDRELEWKPCADCGTSMSQDDYDEFEEICTDMDGDLDYMSEGEAKKLIAEEFGFSPDKVEIVDTVHTYEINRHEEVREVAAYKRLPLYDSVDHNYIRFDVRCAAAVRSYEMIDGELKDYHC